MEVDTPNNHQTLNEYLAQRAAEEQRKYYLEGSRNRNESKNLGVIHKFSNSEISSFINHIEYNEKEISRLIDKISENLNLDRKYVSKLIKEGKSPIEASNNKDAQWYLSHIRELKD